MTEQLKENINKLGKEDGKREKKSGWRMEWKREN